MSRQPRRPRKYAAAAHRQRGVAAVMFAVAAIALVTTVMLGFNVGQLYYAQRTLERQGALAALAGAQVASGCRSASGATGVPGSLAAVTSAVLGSLAVNTGSGGTQPAATVELGRIDRASSISQYNVFVPLAAGTTGIDSVRVRLSQAQPPVLAAALFPGSGGNTLSASATGTQLNTAEFTVGTTLVNVLLNPFLSSLLGASVNISAVSYNGLASANVSLQNLMIAANVNNLNDLLAVSTNLKGALGILSAALSAGTDNTSAAAAALVATLGGQTTAGGTVTFGDVIGSALGTAFNPVVGDAVSSIPFINGADLLKALALDAAAKTGSSYQITIPVTLAIPGVVSSYLLLQVIQPAQYAIGPVGTTAKTSQVVLKLRLQIGGQGLLGLGLLNVAAVNLALDVNLANGSGTLSQLQCPTALNANPSATIAVTSSVATLKLGAFSGAPATSAVSGGAIITSTLLGLPLVTIGLNTPVTTQVGTAASNSVGPFTTFDAPVATVPPLQPANTYTTTGSTGSQTVGSVALLSTAVPGLISSLTANGNLTVTAGGLPLGPTISTVASSLGTLILNPLSSALSGVIDAALQLLGIQLGLVTIDLQNVTIGAPVVSSFCSPSNPSPGVPGC